MKKKVAKNNGEDYKKIKDTISDHLFENHRVCGLDEISSTTGIPRSKCGQLANNLVKTKQIYEIFSGKGKPTLYIPYDMMQGVLSLQPKPEWVTGYEFKEKSEKSKKIEEINKEINDFENYERLLYTTDKPLEKAVEFCLNFLEFEDVIHLDNAELHDLEFKYEGKTFLIEAKGKTKQGDKVDVQQLRGWVDMKIDEGFKVEDLQGILVVNHFRNDDPSQRGDPLTDKAIEYMKLSSFKFFTGVFLFKIIKEVIEGKITKEQARKKIIKGERY